MSPKLTPRDIEAWFEDRLREHGGRGREAWDEYLTSTRGCTGTTYDQVEALAWRRLRRQQAELAHDRRRIAFERDRALAEIHGLRLAS